jgi:aquaporin Z
MYAIGPISGCHVNPAVTAGLLVTRRIAPLDAFAYIVAQCAGAILAAATIWLIADSNRSGYSPSAMGLHANGYDQHSIGGFGWSGAFLVEVLLTGFAGLAVGLALTVTNLVSIPVDGASINPARSLGPAVFVGGWALSQLWLFIVAPLLGALLAAGAHAVLRPALQAGLLPAERPLSDESLHKIARETAMLIRGRSG